MKIYFHDEFNPEFINLFLQDKSYLQMKEDQDHHPRLLELITDLGKPPIFLVNILLNISLIKYQIKQMLLFFFILQVLVYS